MRFSDIPRGAAQKKGMTPVHGRPDRGRADRGRHLLRLHQEQPVRQPVRAERGVREHQPAGQPLAGADRGRGRGQGREGRADGERVGAGPREDGDHRRGPADQEGRGAEGALAAVPRGQLLRGAPARHARIAQPRGRRHDPAEPDGVAGAVRPAAHHAAVRDAIEPAHAPARVLLRPQARGRRRASTRRSSTGRTPTATPRRSATPTAARSRTTSRACSRARRRCSARCRRTRSR